jgi:arginyl-tRNA--protein-N-Asp/Glu arginylyltransferase
LNPYSYYINPEEISDSELDELLALGWYRMHQAMFTISHLELDQPHRVHWLRYHVNQIKNQASHSRIRRRNKNFRFTIEDLVSVPANHIELHARYRAAINFNGAPTIYDCLFGEADASKNIFNTKYISVFDNERLIAGGYFDVGEKAAASILHFFDPLYKKNSLGKYLILLTLDYLNQSRFEYYYPGYVVEGLSKMDYKLFVGREYAYYFEPETIPWKILKWPL